MAIIQAADFIGLSSIFRGVMKGQPTGETVG
jgi:hypothetical protein